MFVLQQFSSINIKRQMVKNLQNILRKNIKQLFLELFFDLLTLIIDTREY